MNCLEAMAALIIGKKVRNRRWSREEYVHFVDGILTGDDGATDLVLRLDNEMYFEEFTGAEEEEEEEEEEDSDWGEDCDDEDEDEDGDF